MVTLEKFGNSAVKFEFEDNALYLNNGEITVPLNALMLVIDESDLATFKKLNGDPFVSVSYSDLGMSKSELEQWYKDNMVGGGGSESGLTPSDVQDMIDASISGYDEDIQDEIGEKEQVIAIALTELKNDKADTSAVTEAIDAATSGKVDTSDYETYTAATDATLATKADKNEIPSVSGYADSVEYNSTTKYVNFYHGGTGGTVVYSFNAAPFVIDGMVQDVVISGGSLVISFNTDAGKQDISIPLTEIFDPANYYDKTATDAAINAATSGKVDTSAYTAYTAATNARLTEDEEVTAAALNALEDELANKQDTLVAGSGITISGNVISAEGGGKAVTGGTNISVTTGETADTINCTLPITISNSDNGSKQSIAIGDGSSAHISNWYDSITIGKNSKGYFGSVVIGSNPTAYSQGNGSNVAIGNGTKFYDNSVIIGSHAEGYNGFTANSVAIGGNASAKNIKGAVAIGYGVSTTGTIQTNINKQLKIDTSNQIYIKNKENTEEICLQDYLGGGTVDPSLDSGSTNAVANSAITAAFDDVDARLAEDEEVTAAGINAVNDKFGGLRIVKLSQQEYDALTTKDNNTMYVVV